MTMLSLVTLPCFISPLQCTLQHAGIDLAALESERDEIQYITISVITVFPPRKRA